MTPEIPVIVNGKFSVTRKWFAEYAIGCVPFFVFTLIGHSFVKDPMFDLTLEEELPYHLMLVGMSFFFLATCLILLFTKEIKGSARLDHSSLSYARGKKYQFRIRLQDIASASRKEDTVQLVMKNGDHFEMLLSNVMAHEIGSFLTLYLAFRDIVPLTIWKRFTFQDYYAPKEFHSRSVRFFKQGAINCHVDCGWIITIKKTSYFFPLPWPASFGKQHTGFNPPPGFMPQNQVVPKPVSINLHLLLKATLASPIPSYQKEQILASISRQTGGGPIFGPLYNFFRPRESTKNGMIYLDVPIMWAKHVAVREPELQ